MTTKKDSLRVQERARLAKAWLEQPAQIKATQALRRYVRENYPATADPSAIVYQAVRDLPDNPLVRVAAMQHMTRIVRDALKTVMK